MTEFREYSGLKISVVVPCHNGEKTLALVLREVFRQQPWEVLVIDDGSTDNSADIARRFDLRLITHPTCRGVAAARNSAIKEAGGDILVFLDADAVPQPGLLTGILAGYEQDDVAGIGGTEIATPCRSAADCWRKIFWLQTHGEVARQDVPMLPGLCSSYRRRVVLEAGGFDERFRTHGEDVELGIRLHRRGYRLRYDPAIQVAHHRHDTFRSMLQMIYRHTQGQSLAYLVHEESVAELWYHSLRWLPVSVGSSLRRHRSIRLALLSFPAFGAALMGRLAAYLHRRGLRDGSAVL